MSGSIYGGGSSGGGSVYGGGAKKKKDSGDDGFLGTGIGPSISGTLNDVYHGTIDTAEAVPKAAAGLITGATSGAYHGLYGAYAAAGAGVSNLLGKNPSGYWRAADENLNQAGELPVGLVQSGAGTISDIANLPANLTGNNNLPRPGDWINKKVGRGLAEIGGVAAARGGDIPDNENSQRIVDSMGEDRKAGFRPMTFSEKQKKEGTGAAVLETLGNVALLGKGIKGMGDATSTLAEGSHPGIADLGQKVADVGERMEKPLKGIGKATITPLMRAALESRANAGGIIVPEEVPGSPAAAESPATPNTAAAPAEASPQARPPTYYHGSGRDTAALTGNPEWDNNRFVTHDRGIAELYGPEVHEVTFKPGTRILEAGTPEFDAIRDEVRQAHPESRGLMDENIDINRVARERGYHVVDYKRDYIGAPILDQGAVESGPWQAPESLQEVPHGGIGPQVQELARKAVEDQQRASEGAQAEAAKPQSYTPTIEHPNAVPAHSAGEIGGVEPVSTRDLAAEASSKAAEAKVRELSPTAEEFSQRQAKPIAPWAEKVVEKLGPDSRVTKTLAGLERHAQRTTAGLIATELKRAGIEVPRSQDLQDPFIKATIEAANVMKEQNPKMSLDDISRFVGDALHGRIAGLGEHGILKPEIDALTEKGDLKGARELRDTGYQHVMPEAARTPELGAVLDKAVEHYKDWAKTTQEGYESSTTHGPRGLEDANATEPTANKGVEKLQKQIESLRNRATRLGQKVPKEVEKLERDLATLKERSARQGEQITQRASLRNAAAEQLARIANAEPPEGKGAKNEGKLPGMGDLPKEPKARTATQIARAAKAAEGESPNAGVQRGVTTGFTAADIAHAGDVIAKNIKDKAGTDKAISELEDRIANKDTRSAALSEKATKVAEAAQEKLTKALDKQPVSQWPRRLQPAGRAFTTMLKQAEDNPALKELVGDAEPTFRAFMQRAVKLGMDPQYVADLSEAKVHELSAERVPTRLGRLMVSGARKDYTGNLAKMGGVDRSVEAFMAARTAMHQEITTNVGTEYWKRNFAIKVPKGTTFDRGGDYAAWDPTTPDGRANNTVRETSGVHRFTSPGYLVPKSLLTAIKRSEQDFSTGWQQANKYVMNPWRNAVITASPQFYINHTLGHAVLASIEGVRLKDWVEAVDAYRKRGESDPNNPYHKFTGHSEVNQGTSVEPSMIDAGGIRERIARAEGTGKKIGAASHGVAAKLHNVTNVVDGVTRAAVYISKKDKGYSDGEAIQRAYSSVVDYNDLSPAEQQIARAVIPFYAFQKQILKIVAKFPVDHPVVLGLGAALGRINAQQMQDQFGTTMPLGYQGLIPNGRGAIQTRGLNPFKDSFSLASPDGIAAALNPALGGAIRIGFNAPSGGYVKNRKMDSYGNTVPDVGLGDVGSDVTGQLPFVSEAEALSGLGKGPVRGTIKAFGLNTYSPEELTKLTERIKGSKAAVDANSPFATTKKKKGSGVYG